MTAAEASISSFIPVLTNSINSQITHYTVHLSTCMDMLRSHSYKLLNELQQSSDGQLAVGKEKPDRDVKKVSENKIMNTAGGAATEFTLQREN